jgi:thiosulfate/3-mercaptopyruvate sulfurtransferase
MPSPLVETEWLAAHLSDSDVAVIDASWHMAATKRDAVAEFEAAHIPGAQFFHLEELSDRTSDLPHMMPPADQFARGMGALGISNDTNVVVYDTVGFYSAPRAWWMLRAFGHDRVAILNGGLPKWQREGRPVESGPARPGNARFTARLREGMVRDYQAVLGNVATKDEQVVDARSPGRFTAEEKEPRAGLRSGHIPGACNVHYAELLAHDGTLKPVAELRRIFAERGVDLARPLVTSCGSGVTAATVLFAAEVAGARHTALYDGSWTDWGSRADAPIATGAA